MKAFKAIGIYFMLVLFIGFNSACVSVKKYRQIDYERGIALADKYNAEQNIKTLEESNRRLKKDTTNFGIAYRNILAQYTDLKNASNLTTQQLTSELQSNSEILALKESELAEKEEQLKEREALVKELQRIIRQKEQAQRSLMTNLETAFVNYSSEDLTIERRGGLIYVSLSEQLLFKPGKTDIDARGKSALSALAEVLRYNPNLTVTIEGHTDNDPIKTNTYKDNWDLSVYRATSIVRILTKEYGVSPTRVVAAGRGEHYPVASNINDIGKSKNRRTEIILTPKLDEIYSILKTSTYTKLNGIGTGSSSTAKDNNNGSLTREQLQQKENTNTKEGNQ